ncbi:translation initiation/elongation factor MRX8 [Aspergillus stella-maris]|uniref:translation initiation/elongation factor MRX8 n=1 Tax=Aspergillus stella-maris TaxID=1810926 RepID=UPI003CCE489B
MLLRPSICRSCYRRLAQSASYRTLVTSTTTTRPPTPNPSTTPQEQPQPEPQTIRALPPSTLSYYWDTVPPTDSQLSFSNKLFTPTRHGPLKLWSAAKFRTTPVSSLEPEVAFLGRSNVGKSSLLNAIMGKEMCWTSSKPGKTREMNAFGIGGTKGGESKIVLLDMPGYGKASRAEWGGEILKYLTGRKQLRRAFLLIDSSHGLKKTDMDILHFFRQNAIPHQIILSKVDKILSKNTLKPHSIPSPQRLAYLRSILEELRPVIQPIGRNEGPGALGEILTCSADTSLGNGEFLGVAAVRWAIASAAGLDGAVEARAEMMVPGVSGGVS